MKKKEKEEKFRKVMREYKDDELNIGKSKKKVKSRKQALAVALSVSKQGKKKK